MMLLLLLLLGTCFCVGFSYNDMEEYGKTHRMKLHREAESLEFTPTYNSDATVLWRRDDPPTSEDRRRKVMGAFYVIYNLTQEDSGRYIMRDKNWFLLSVRTIEVVENKRSYVRRTGESINITFNLDPTSCNIYFLPESDLREINIVRYGRLQEDSYGLACPGFELLKPCGILNVDLQMSCSGNYEVRDPNGNKALVALLEMDSGANDPSNIGIGIGIFCAVISCCVCLKSCCCKKRSSKKDRSETPKPAVHYQEYDREPVGARSKQHSPATGTHYSTQPSTSQTGPLIHTPPTTMPPTYSKVSAPAEEGGAPTFPVLSDPDPDPRFELKGLRFSSAPPLSSDTTCSDVYTSDKLNFL